MFYKTAYLAQEILGWGKEEVQKCAQTFINPCHTDYVGENNLSLEPACYKKQQKEFLTSYWFVEQVTSEDSEWYKIDPG